MDSLSSNTVLSSYVSAYLAGNNLNNLKGSRFSKRSENKKEASQVLFRRQDGNAWIVIERKPSGKIKGYLEGVEGERARLIVKGIPDQLRMEHVGNAKALLNHSNVSLKNRQVEVVFRLKGGSGKNTSSKESTNESTTLYFSDTKKYKSDKAVEQKILDYLNNPKFEREGRFQIEGLHFFSNSSLSKKMVRGFIKKCINLRALSLAEMNYFDGRRKSSLKDDFLVDVLQSCQHLEYLDVRDMYDEYFLKSIKEIAKHPNLKELYLSHLPSLEREAPELRDNFHSMLGKLTELNLEEVDKSGDSINLIKTYCQNLRIIDFELCRRLTTDDILGLVFSLPKLEKIRFSSFFSSSKNYVSFRDNVNEILKLVKEDSELAKNFAIICQHLNNNPDINSIYSKLCFGSELSSFPTFVKIFKNVLDVREEENKIFIKKQEEKQQKQIARAKEEQEKEKLEKSYEAYRQASEKQHLRNLAETSDINTIYKSGLSFLDYAVEQGYEDIVELLLNKKAKPNALDQWGVPTLVRAAEKGNSSIIKKLLDAGVNINTPSENGYTPLHCAAEKEYENVVELLLQRGANVNSLNQWGATPLAWAVEKGNIAISKKLLDAGANANLSSKDGRVPLHRAVEKEHEDIVQLILDLKKVVNVDAADENGFTPLHLAVKTKNKKILELLLKKGADVNVPDRKGCTPLDLAIRTKSKGTLSILSRRLELAKI